MNVVVAVKWNTPAVLGLDTHLSGGCSDSCGMLMATAAKQMWQNSLAGPQHQNNTESQSFKRYGGTY